MKLQPWNLEAYISEFIGTFFLVFTVSLNALQRTAHAAMSIGCMYMVMVSATSSISGGHFNPAVTLGVLFGRGSEHICLRDVCIYISVQLLGGLLAGILSWHVVGATYALHPGHGYTPVTTSGISHCPSRPGSMAQPCKQLLALVLFLLSASALADVGDVGDKQREVMDFLASQARRGAPKYIPHALLPGEPRHCSEIKNPRDCMQSSVQYGFSCKGWGGSRCLEQEGYKCGDITNERICGASFELFGMSCSGFSNGQCQSGKSSKPNPAAAAAFLAQKKRSFAKSEPRRAPATSSSSPPRVGRREWEEKWG